ncbi:ATP-binding cassette domain-containing protein [soil metagenome]
MEDVISVEHLIKKYKHGTTNAVDDISFSVKAGEFFTLLGPNGAGKTTTLSILNTTLSKTSGSVKVAGFDLETQSSQVRQSIGVIFQNPSLDLNLTAEENIRFHAILYGVYPFAPTYGLMPAKYKEKVQELSKILDLHEKIFDQIKTYSGGMKRKLEIIRGLIHNPKILFLDEPTTGLDPLSRANLWEYIMNVRKELKTTIFLTTHYLEEAENADTVLIINHGKIISVGSPASLKNEFVEEYITVDAKERKALLKELQKHKLRFEGEGPFMIHLGKHSVQQVIQLIKVKLNLIKVHTPTLEEAYLEVIKENHDENT